MSTSDVHSYQRTTINHEVNPNHVSFTTDGKNKISDPSTSYLHQYSARVLTEDTPKFLPEMFEAKLKPHSMINTLFIRHAEGKQVENGVTTRIENYHVCITYTPKDEKIVALLNSSELGKKMRPDNSGHVLHLDPAIGSRDKQFFEKGEYQTKYLPGMVELIALAQQNNLLEDGEQERLLQIIKNAGFDIAIRV